MQWFVSWWDALSNVQQVLACVAIPATVILLLQTILLMFGVGGMHDADGADHDFESDADHDLDHDTDHDGDHGNHVAGLRIFTVRGMVAFLAVGGWLGIVMIGAGLNTAVSCLIAFAGGVASLLLVAAFLKWTVSLQESGNLSFQNAVGHSGEVYLSIPARQSGRGKVTLTVQERYVEADAVTDSPDRIPVGQRVRVVALTDDQTLLVEPVSSGPAPKS